MSNALAEQPTATVVIFPSDPTWTTFTVHCHDYLRVFSTHSGVHIQSRLDHSQPLADDVTAGRLDNAFLTPPLLSHAVSLVEFELPPVRIIGVLPKGHPSVSKRELNLKRLRDENFVLPEPTCGRAFTFS